MDLIEYFRTQAVAFSEYLDADSLLAFTFVVGDESVDGRIEGNTLTIQRKDDTEKDIVLTTTKAVFEDIAAGKIDAFTAAAKGDVRDAAPLEWEMKRSLDKAKIDSLYAFLMHFFQPTPIRTVTMDPKRARTVHGAAAIPLFYKTGMRSAFYTLSKGDQLNEPGDTNPFDQAFIVIGGTGKAKIGKHTFALEDHVAYHVPKDSDHVVWNESEDRLELIWIAWGEGA